MSSNNSNMLSLSPKDWLDAMEFSLQCTDSGTRSVAVGVLNPLVSLVSGIPTNK